MQAAALLLILPLAVIATAAIVRPPSTAGRPEVLVVGTTAATRWAHGSLGGLGPVVLSSSTPQSPGLAETEIHYRDGASRAQAAAVRRSLGRGRLVASPALEEGFPVIVYLGKDTPHP